MSISDEAVEAAALAIAEASPDWAYGEWGNTAISDRFRDGTRAEARAALEAAAPYIAAEVLESAADDLRPLNPPYANWLSEPERNPYRSQA